MQKGGVEREDKSFWAESEAVAVAECVCMVVSMGAMVAVA